MCRRLTSVVCLISPVLFVLSLSAQSGTVRYIYDELGRLAGVIDTNGDAAAYHYDPVGNLLSISRSTSSQVKIIEFTPNGGPIGQTVSIYGTGFSATAGQNTVTFNGTTASVTSASTTSLVVTVPSGATTGIISITSPNGSANSSTSFVVATSSAPTITSFSPTVGAIGTTVTVSGTNFDTLAQNRLAVNRTRAHLSSATSTSLQTAVPALAASGRFTVTTLNGTATSTDDFFIPPSPYVASDVAATGRLTAGTASNLSINTASKIGLVVFDGTAGQRISLKVVPGPVSDMALHRPDQTVLSTHSTGIFTSLMEPPLLPATGTYQFMVDPTGSTTGTHALTLYEVPADIAGTITPGGSAVTVSTTVPGQNAKHTFTGAVNDRISLLISGGPGGAVSLLKPDTTTLGSLSIGFFSSFLDTTVLPASGTYSLFTNYDQANTGSVTLTLYSVPADVSGSITPGGSSVNVGITTPGQNGLLTFSGTSGDRVSLNVSSGPSGTVTLRRPDNSQQAFVYTGFLGPFMEPQTLASTGTYSITVDPENAATGTLTFSLYNVPADTTGSVTIGGSAVGVTLGTPGQNGTLTFSGTASQQVTVHMTSNTMGVPTIRLLKPDGSQLTSGFSSFSNFDLSTQTLPVTGTYTIVIDPDGAATGSINVSVSTP
jgi:YD repeat-containing protein